MSLQDKHEKIIQIADRELEGKGFVTPIDILLGLGLLAPSCLERWKRGCTECLEEVLQSSLPKISNYLEFLKQWAESKRLKFSRLVYLSSTRNKERLKFTKNGNRDSEEQFSTHFVSPLIIKREQSIQEKFVAPELLCLIVVADRKCAQCGTELPKGSFLFMEKDSPLCLKCANLDQLVFLPSQCCF